ncbi:MAG: hypothetical protein HN353_09365 [Bdellovibrionales bacterium]|jgi:hypothetical protein|nr:hypothetical protein [Bdellovibrionales bacterium]MBT3527341.1 hypothetical protein [Bdellovibrionales bacterium]MBT7668028.1 hypothetical protein [Bdellovibrionales bacterium]MBT7766788.1 hypothetical protein [Bdellovibrionales bacterium]
MRSCKEIAQLLVPGQKLSLMQRVEIKMHLLFCKCCGNQQKQLEIIGRALQRYDQQFKNDSKQSERCQELTETIIKKIIS